MSQNFQFGYQHYLNLAHTTGTPIKFNCRPGVSEPASPVHFNNVTWVAYDNVTTVNVGGSSTTVDITTRDEARSGFNTQVVVTTQGQMTFDVRYKPTDDAGLAQDLGFEALLKAWLGKVEIAAIDFDKPPLTLGAQGLVGNWTVNITNKKELQGVVMCTIEMNLSSLPNWIRCDATTGADAYEIIS